MEKSRDGSRKLSGKRATRPGKNIQLKLRYRGWFCRKKSVSVRLTRVSEDRTGPLQLRKRQTTTNQSRPFLSLWATFASCAFDSKDLLRSFSWSTFRGRLFCVVDGFFFSQQSLFFPSRSEICTFYSRCVWPKGFIALSNWKVPKLSPSEFDMTHKQQKIFFSFFQLKRSKFVCTNSYVVYRVKAMGRVESRTSFFLSPHLSKFTAFSPYLLSEPISILLCQKSLFGLRTYTTFREHVTGIHAICAMYILQTRGITAHAAFDHNSSRLPSRPRGQRTWFVHPVDDCRGCDRYHPNPKWWESKLGWDGPGARKDEWMPRRAQICRLILLIQNEIRVVPRREKMSRPFLSFSVYSVRS